MIKRKDFWLSACIGLTGLLVCLIGLCIIIEKDYSINPLLFFLICFIVIQASNILKCHKCKCPHCGAGGHILEGSHYWYRLGWANKNSFTCPDCNHVIKII